MPQPLPEVEKPLSDLAINVYGLVRDQIAKLRSDVQELAQTASMELTSDEKLSQLQSEWDTKRQAFDASYQAAKDRSSAHESVLKQLADLENRGVTLSKQIDQIAKEISDLGKPDEQFPTLLKNWRSRLVVEADLLAEQCGELTSLSGGRIRATLRKNSDFEAAQGQFSTIVRGSSIRSQKIDELFASLASLAGPLEGWSELCDDLLALALLDKPVEEGAQLPDSNRLKSVMSTAEMVRLANKFGPDEWVDLALRPVLSRPVFEYMTKEGEYIAFEEASAGQQATALLGALLNQHGIPLIIDQPEDDLDSQVIVDVVNRVWKAKSGRQLIFSSHNANLVVNGDAELVACCDYLVAGEQSKGRIKLEGAIDVKAIREEIAKVMEGGKEAFRLRSEKYGF